MPNSKNGAYSESGNNKKNGESLDESERHRRPKRALQYVPLNLRERGRPLRAWKHGIDQYMRDRAIGEDD
ncbi:hypothetical protein Trydic_g550 [Trypoxylus dichotomus]